MAISLSKGEKVNLSKSNPSIKRVLVGLGWDFNKLKYTGGYNFDLDASAFLLNANGKTPDDKHFVFYNNKQDPYGCTIYGGDNRTGEGEGDDETIEVNLSLVPQHVEKIAFTVTIFDAEIRKQNFGQVENAYIRLVDLETNEELLKFTLTEQFNMETALVVAEIYRYGKEWKFNAVGSGYNNGLAGLCNDFGLEVE